MTDNKSMFNDLLEENKQNFDKEFIVKDKEGYHRGDTTIHSPQQTDKALSNYFRGVQVQEKFVEEESTVLRRAVTNFNAFRR